MSRVEHSKVGQVPHRLVISFMLSIYCEFGQFLGLEFVMSREADGIGSVQIPLPVADPVGIAGPDEDADVLVYQPLEGGVVVSGICAILERR